jgi:hypothetical protein
VLALLACLAYVHVLWQPLISDDYVQIGLGRQYGPIAEWPALAKDALYRSRATSILVTHATETAFGIMPWLLYATMLALHIANTWLVAALIRGSGFGASVAFGGAAYFAVQAGHQEAVMWYAALPELLVFTCLALFVLAWRRWLTGGSIWLVAALAAFAAALLSKESAVVAIPLAVGMNWVARVPFAKWAGLAPMAAMAAVYAWGIFEAQEEHLHFNDGTFSLRAPFWITLRNSLGRLLWLWGAVALAWLVVSQRWPEWRKTFQYSCFWAVVAFSPYVFLTYMPRVPSRHTYLASAGLALLVGSAWVSFRQMAARPWVALAAVAVLGSELGYLWMVKRPQLLERARPTEELLQFAAANQGPFYLRCFPIQHQVAVATIKEAMGRPEDHVVIDAAQGKGLPEFCFGGEAGTGDYLSGKGIE